MAIFSTTILWWFSKRSFSPSLCWELEELLPPSSSSVYWRSLVKLLREYSPCYKVTFLTIGIVCTSLRFPYLALSLRHCGWTFSTCEFYSVSWHSCLCIYLLFQILEVAFLPSLTAQEGFLISIWSDFMELETRNKKNLKTAPKEFLLENSPSFSSSFFLLLFLKPSIH